MKSAVDAAPAEQTRSDPGFPAESAESALHRIGEVAMYSVDPLCRRAAPLQQTAQAKNDFVALNPADAERLGLADGAMARVTQGDAQIEVAVTVTGRVPAGGAWLRSATCVTRTLGPAVGACHGGGSLMSETFLDQLLYMVLLLAKILAIVVPLILAVAYYTYLERKVIGYMQIRRGPNRIGPLGLVRSLSRTFSSCC